MPSFSERPIAITDLETTGLDPWRHEIIELGLVLADPRTLDILTTLNLRITPKRLEDADPKALEVNGFAEDGWRDALPLEEAFKRYAEATKEAVFMAYNATFDWPFISRAFSQTGMKNEMDYHRLDLLSLAYAALKDSGIERFRLSEIAKFLGLEEEPLPHRAVNGAMLAYEVYKKISR